MTDYKKSRPMRKTVVISQAMTVSNTLQFNVQQAIKGFSPKCFIVRQLLYSQVGTGTDNGIYIVRATNLDQNIGAVYIGIQANSQMPESIIEMPDNVQTISFQVLPASAEFSKSITQFPDPTGLLTMTLEFNSDYPPY